MASRYRVDLRMMAYDRKYLDVAHKIAKLAAEATAVAARPPPRPTGPVLPPVAAVDAAALMARSLDPASLPPLRGYIRPRIAGHHPDDPSSGADAAAARLTAAAAAARELRHAPISGRGISYGHSAAAQPADSPPMTATPGGRNVPPLLPPATLDGTLLERFYQKLAVELTGSAGSSVAAAACLASTRGRNDQLLQPSGRDVSGVAASHIPMVHLPTRKRLYTVNRSPHVNKKHRDQFHLTRRNANIQLTSGSLAAVQWFCHLLKVSEIPGVEMQVTVKTL